MIILVYLQCFSLTCLPLIFTQFLCSQPTISLDPSHDVFSSVFWRGLHAAIMGTGPAGLPSSESFVPKITTQSTPSPKGSTDSLPTSNPSLIPSKSESPDSVAYSHEGVTGLNKTLFPEMEPSDQTPLLHDTPKVPALQGLNPRRRNRGKKHI